ncbi:MAG: ATP-binding protein [Nanoarchaeota archaeon]
MIRYTVVPRDIQHPTPDEIQLIESHIKHDVANLQMACTNSSDSYLQVHSERITRAVDSLKANQNPNQRVRLIPLLEELYALLETRRRKLEEEDRHMIIGFSSPEVGIVNNNPDVLYMQLFNFAQNAIEVYGDKRSISIEIKAKELTFTTAELSSFGRNKNGYTSQDPFVKVCIGDYAGGIPEEILVSGQIFQPRFTTKKTGTGLGLSLVEYVCDHLHGFCTAETDRGRSFFNLYLPVERKS